MMSRSGAAGVELFCTVCALDTNGDTRKISRQTTFIISSRRVSDEQRKAARTLVLPSSRERYQHRNSLAIDAIGLAIGAHQIAFFKLNREDDIGGGHDRKEQMAKSHARRDPESDDETEIEGVTDHLVQT